MTEELKPGCIAMYRRYFPHKQSEDIKVKVIGRVGRTPNGFTRWVVEILDPLPRVGSGSHHRLRVSGWRLDCSQQELEDEEAI